MKRFNTKIIRMYNKLLGHLLSPSMAILRKKFTTMPKSIQRLIFIIIIVVIGVISYAVVSTIRSLAQQQKAAEVSQSKKYTGAGLQAPDYTTILPVGKTIESLGGWTRVSPTNRNPVFAFIDTIDGKQIFVNQQPLPPVFIDKMGNQDESQIAQLTQGNTKNDKITVGQTTVYIGTSAKGPQSVIFGKNNLLVLIKSSVAITNDQWARYVNSLK